MKSPHKLCLIVGTIIGLNCLLDFDLRFTIINLTWCIPIAIEWWKENGRKSECKISDCG
jgi:hypothetical protein